MKNITKIISMVLILAILMTGFTACGSSPADSTTTDDSGSTETLKIGVIKYGSHPSLDNCYTGVKEGLEASGLSYEIDMQDGNFDSATCDTIAKNMVSKNYDLIVAIATPAAVSAYSAAANTNIPVVFCAVSDPAAAMLVDSNDAPGGNCTGTSDVLDFEAQLELITTLQPDAETIGVLYTTSEANSVSQLAMFTEAAAELGIEVISQGVQTAADIPQAAASLCAKVDCVNNFTDNNVVSQLTTLLQHANENGIPVYGSEEEQVINGCLGSMSIDYIALGKVTAEMAVEIINGADASTMAVRTISDATPVINSEVLESFSITLPEKYEDATLVTAADAE